MNKPIICVFATDEKMGFAKEGRIPWHLGDDLAFFKSFTTKTMDPEKQNAIIMGRKSWDDIPAERRPLKDRLNVVLTSSPLGDVGADSRVLQLSSLTAALKVLNQAPTVESIMVVGGEKLLREAFLLPDCRLIVQSIIPGDFNCDQHLRAPISFKLTEMSPIGPMVVYWLVKDEDGN